jgi:surfactin synthase thioesterase subunit
MKSKKFSITNIPAIIYGEPSEQCFLFIHGKQGNKEEAAAFADIVCPKGWQVLGIDLPEHGERKQEKNAFNPWHVIPELKEILEYLQRYWNNIGLRANSIGAWFAMQSFHGSEFAKSLFVSPILDMEKLIQNLMMGTGVTEEMLKDKQLIETNFGETLSWKYYQFVKEHPITEWNCKTHILYGGKDNMTSKDIVYGFANRFHATLTVMEDGEHWFHTPEQLQVLNQWEIDFIDF